MSLAEKKQSLMYIIEEADEKLMGLLIALANEYNTSGEEYTDEEINDFHKTSNEYLQKPEVAFTIKEAHHKVRNKHRDAI